MSLDSSWQNDYKCSIRNTKELSSFLETDIPKTSYSVFIPLKFAEKIKASGVNSPLWKQFVPVIQEDEPEGFIDPIGDQLFGNKGGIIHRYKSRILFSPTTVCPILCRYCFRKNELDQNLDTFTPSLTALKEYLKNHTEVEEVILTGGDPLIVSNQKLEEIFQAISQFKSIKYIRLHSRTPIIIPSRLDSGLKEVFKKFENHFETISLVIHVNHASELTEEIKNRLESFREFNLLSQSVLLKGVNDNKEDLIHLFKSLNSFGIRPYYLHHPDKVKGAMHFYLPLEEGRKIYGQLREDLPGWLIPTYILDSEQGTGKNLAYNPEKIEFSGTMLDRFNREHIVSM